MPWTPLLRWALVRVVRFPWFWLWLAALAALGPLVQEFRPLGITARELDGSGLLREVSFLAILAGNLAGLSILPEAPFLLAGLGRLR